MCVPVKLFLCAYMGIVLTVHLCSGFISVETLEFSFVQS